MLVTILFFYIFTFIKSNPVYKCHHGYDNVNDNVKNKVVTCTQTTTVSSGDTLYAIAVANDLTLDEIISLNTDIENPNLILIDQEICIKGTKETNIDTVGETFDTLDSTLNKTTQPSRIIYNCVEPGMFALTFDDGPSKDINLLLDKLTQLDVKVTFYVNGNNFADLINNQEDKNNLKAIYDKGHQIGSHTFSHKDLSTLTDKEIIEEMKLNRDAISSIIQLFPTSMRPPYLNAEQNVLDIMGELEYSVVSTNLDTKDFENNGEVDSNVNNIKQKIEESDPTIDSFISLQHDFTTKVVATTEEIIDLATKKGYKFVTIEECINEKAYK